VTMALWLVGSPFAVPTPRGTAALQQIDRPNPPVGWSAVENSNMPLGRGTAGICTGPWGVMVYGGELTEHMWTAQTLLLHELGGQWQTLSYPEGSYPAARANPGMARYGAGCLMFGGVGDPSLNYPNYGDTWFWTPTGGWTELTLSPSPSPRFYHTLVPMSNGELIMFGGRTRLFADRIASGGDTWVYNASGWTNITTSIRGPGPSGGSMLTNVPPPRWGHGMTCGLTHTGSPQATMGPLPTSKLECVMYGGSQMADADYFDDTWIVRVQVDPATGAEVVPRTYYWEQVNTMVKPHGRWCFSMATCGSRVVMVGGSTDYRISADETWVWEPTIRPVEDPSHPPGHQGEWVRYYGIDPIHTIPNRPAAAGPLHISGFGITNVGALGASDIVLFGGVNNQIGGNFVHKGWETAEMFTWPCTPETWPEAMVASPPTPPSPPPPPVLSLLPEPFDYAGGTRGYIPTPTDPTGSRNGHSHNGSHTDARS